MNLSAELRTLMEGFAAGETRASKRRGRYLYPVRRLRQARVARNQCAVVSEHFEALLRQAGIAHESRVLIWNDTRHYVTLIDDHVVDWTARQFDTSTAWPLVERWDAYVLRVAGGCLGPDRAATDGPAATATEGDL